MAERTALKWWQWGTVQRRLTLWTKALLQGQVYNVVLDPRKTETGFTDPSNRRIVINPESAGESDEEQWTATKGLLAHEAGHVLFTDAWPEGEAQERLRDVVNYLEDERVERGMTRLYPGVGWEIAFLGDLTWADFRERGGRREDSAARLLGGVLAWRWARSRGGHQALVEALCFDEEDEEVWAQMRPLVEEAWEAPDTAEVIEIARRILEILDLPEGWELPNWLTMVACAHRDLFDERRGEPMSIPTPIGDGDGDAGDVRTGDGAENAHSEGDGNAANGSGDSDDAASGGSGESADDDTDVQSSEPRRLERPPVPAEAGGEPPLSYREMLAAKDGQAVRVPPAPYLELEQRAQPLRGLWVAELQPPQPDRRPMPHQWRGRYSWRQESRDPERPFLLGQARAPSSDGLAIQVLVDRSGSMSINERMEKAKLALMALHLACQDLVISLSITVFGGYNLKSSWQDELNTVTIQEFDEGGELPKARIAALRGHTACEHLWLALKERGPVLAARPERTRLLLVVHDGDPVYDAYPEGHDYELSQAWFREAGRRGTVIPVGVLLTIPGDDEHYVPLARELFGESRLVVCSADDLPAKLGNLMRCFV